MLKTFQLGAKNYKVKQIEHDTYNLGRSFVPLCLIQIQNLWEGKEVPEISKEQTLFHEVVHCILGEMGRNDLSDDENFVQSFAVLMHQFFRTMK